MKHSQSFLKYYITLFLMMFHNSHAGDLKIRPFFNTLETSFLTSTCSDVCILNLFQLKC